MQRPRAKSRASNSGKQSRLQARQRKTFTSGKKLDAIGAQSKRAARRRTTVREDAAISKRRPSLPPIQKTDAVPFETTRKANALKAKQIPTIKGQNQNKHVRNAGSTGPTRRKQNIDPSGWFQIRLVQ